MKEKVLKSLNILLVLTILIGTVVFSFEKFNIMTYIGSILLVLVPNILSKTKLKFKEKDKFVYYLFLFLAYFLGSIASFYKNIWYYDIIVHTISGMVEVYFAIFILNKIKMYNKKNIFFNLLFVLSFAMMVASLWEIMEFLLDVILKTNLQHNIETGVYDTMEDIICALVGGMSYYLYYNIKRKLQK